jgi:hypothetical protein
VGWLVLAALLSLPATARASLTPSESEQVRRDVATAMHVGRVRALVARPDLSSGESVAAMVGPLTMTPVDREHVTFLHELVFSDASTASRPVLAIVVVRALLARADAVIAEHPYDLDHRPEALGELRRIYGLVEDIAAAGTLGNIPPSSRADCAHALSDHVARNATVLQPQAPVGPYVAQARAQAAIALLDLSADGTSKRVDAATGLALTGVRRALLVERGALLLDSGGADSQVAPVRTLLDRLFAGRDWLEAILVGGDPSRLAARDGAIVAITEAAPSAPLLWGSDVEPPPVDAWTTSIATGLAAVAVSNAIDKKPDLLAQIDRDGGKDAVSAAAAMLAIDAPRLVHVAVAHLAAGHPESAAVLADAVGALSVFAQPGGAGGLSIPVGPAMGGPATIRLTQISIGPTGAAASFRLDGHTWLFERDAVGAVTGMRRDGARMSQPGASGVR